MQVTLVLALQHFRIISSNLYLAAYFMLHVGVEWEMFPMQCCITTPIHDNCVDGC